MWRQDISVINMHERKHFTYIHELHTCKMSKISFNVFCNTNVHYVCVFMEDVVCICLLILLPSKRNSMTEKFNSLSIDLIVLWCKIVQINYNAVFNTLSSWALSVWQFSVFWYMYTDLVTIASLSSKSSLCIDSAKFANAD